jgi:3'(2'), 5'-bisphosphate nucleotidase
VTATYSDDELAARLATSAGDLLLRVRESGLVEGKALGALGDKVANAFLTQVIRELRPDDGMLSEEEVADPARLGKSRVWIIDPLDGTREYSEGRTDWAVHVALAIDGSPAVSAVALPGLGVTLKSAEPVAISASSGPLKIAVSRTRPPAEAEAVAKALRAELVPMGSAGAKTMAVVRGEVDAYLHAGGQYEWDSCAPVGVALAAGLHASRIDGSAARYNREDPYMPDLLVCRADISGQILEIIRNIGT